MTFFDRIRIRNTAYTSRSIRHFLFNILNFLPQFLWSRLGPTTRRGATRAGTPASWRTCWARPSQPSRMGTISRRSWAAGERKQVWLIDFQGLIGWLMCFWMEHLLDKVITAVQNGDDLTSVLGSRLGEGSKFDWSIIEVCLVDWLGMTAIRRSQLFRMEMISHQSWAAD